MQFTDFTDLTKDDVLSAIGLASKRTVAARVLEVAGIFGAGLLIGAAAGILLAPKSGAGMREELGERLRGAAKRVRGGSDGEQPIT